METKFESTVKQIACSQEQVYNTLSDLSNIEKVRDRLPEDKVKNLSFDKDSVTVSVAPVGSITLTVVDREPHKTIKFTTSQSPLPFNLWVQLLPVTETTCKMRLTVKADLNPLVRGMIAGPLQDGIEKMADALAQINY